MSVHPKAFSVYVLLSLVIGDICDAYFVQILLSELLLVLQPRNWNLIRRSVQMSSNISEHVSISDICFRTRGYKPSKVDTACVCSCHVTSDSCQHSQWPHVPLRRTGINFSYSHFEDAINIYANFVISTYKQITLGRSI